MTKPTTKVLRAPDGSLHWIREDFPWEIPMSIRSQEKPALLAALLEEQGWHSFWIKRDDEGLPVGGFHTESGTGLTEILLRVADGEGIGEARELKVFKNTGYKFTNTMKLFLDDYYCLKPGVTYSIMEVK